MIGLGKLGLPCAEMMMRAHDVVDISPRTAPFPIAQTIAEAIEGREIIFVAVPTPHDPAYGGETPTSHLPPKDFDYSIVESVFHELAEHVTDQIVVLISTVLPGTVRSRLAPLLPGGAKLVYNPYLIAMGTVAWDMVNPEMLIIGTKDGDLTAEGKVLADFYATFMENDPRVEIGTWEEAEAIKITYNTFISAKIGLVNMIQDVAERIGHMNVDVVTGALAKSTQRIMGPKYMTAGMGDGGACFHPETPVFTDRGIIQIQNIVVGDRVLTHTGRLKKVISVWRNRHSPVGEAYNSFLLRIKAEGRLATYVTSDHMIYASTDNRKKYVTGGVEKRVTMYKNPAETASSPAQLPASSLKAGDHYTLMPLFLDEVAVPNHATDDYLLLGYYLSEGCIDRSGKGRAARVSFHLHRKEEAFASEIKDALNALDPTVNVSERVHKMRRDVRCSCDYLADLLQADFGKGAAEKRLPAWILYGDISCVSQVLRGAIRGDGHTSKSGFSYSTISKHLALGIQFLLARNGLVATVQEHPARIGTDGTRHKRAYEVRVRNAVHVQKLADLAEMPNLHKMQQKRYNFRGFVKDNLIYAKVRTVKPERYRGDVYDLEVEDDHTYVTPLGYVSNCHPRDNIALRDLASRLGLEYDLFGAIMDAREVQAKHMAEELVRHGNDVVIVGKAYKPGVAYTEGSYSLLVGYYVTQLGKSVHYIDKHTGDIFDASEPVTYLIGYWDDWTDSVVYHPGSVVVDPWRRFDAEGRDLTVIHYGNTRNR